MKKPFVRDPYNYDLLDAGNASSIPDFGPSLTQQHQADEADINTIVRRFGLTGTLPTNIRMPTYADFDEVFDYTTALNAIRSAELSFSALPAHIRFRFNNDPQSFVNFCSDPANLEEAKALGLTTPTTTHSEAARPPNSDSPKGESPPPPKTP